MGCHVLLIAFTTEDLARVCFRGFDPWTETSLSIRVLRDGGRRTTVGLDSWRRSVTRKVLDRNLAPHLREFTDTDPATSETGPRREALEAYRRIAVEPYQRRISAAIETELHTRSQLLLRGGHARALDGLGGLTSWAESGLTAQAAESGEVRLCGQGLTVLPSFFCPTDQVLLLGPEERPTLVYPVRPAGSMVEIDSESTSRHDLAALLGSTRATALRAISESCSTTELARRLHTSLATASQHASVLRGTGLVTTLRCGREVKHILTPLGERLLHGSAIAEDAPPPTEGAVRR